MPENDHDLLIQLSTKMDMILAGQQLYIEQWGKLIERVTAIEIQQGRNTVEIRNIEEELADLRRKTGIADAINTAVAAIAGALAYFFAR